MNLSFPSQTCRPAKFWLAGFIFGLFMSTIQAADLPPKMYQPTNGEFSAIGNAVVALLQTKDAGSFATNVSASSQDWRSLITTNMSSDQKDRLNSYAKGIGYNVQRLRSTARAVLNLAQQLHLNFGKGLSFRIASPRYAGAFYFFGTGPGGEQFSAPYLQTLEIILVPSAESSTNGYFKLTVRGLEKFPGGWRIDNGIQWASFPSNVADAGTLRELVILDKVAHYKGITGQDDPALLKLGANLVEFLQSQDVSVFEKTALWNADLSWAQHQQSGRGIGLSREEFDRQMSARVKEQLANARSVLKQMDDTGIGLKDAKIQIKDASIEHCQFQGAPGSLDGLMGEQFKLTLAVESVGKSKSGTSVSGDYILGANEVMRFENDWRIVDGLRWDQFPPGVVDAATEKKLKFENYIAEYRALPPGMAAPEIQFITLNGERKMKLSDLRGKVVVLDFWATWCGPCQQPMADLQKIRDGHPDWDNKVAIVPLSIDDTIGEVRRHVDKRGWTNTFNVWAGNGGWNSAAAKAFRVTAVPTTYIIDAQGKIVMAGHFIGLPITETVDGLLRR